MAHLQERSTQIFKCSPLSRRAVDNRVSINALVVFFVIDILGLVEELESVSDFFKNDDKSYLYIF